MVEGVATLLRGGNRDDEVLADPFLPDVLVERARPETGLELRVLVDARRGDQAGIGHGRTGGRLRTHDFALTSDEFRAARRAGPCTAKSPIARSHEIGGPHPADPPQRLPERALEGRLAPGAHDAPSTAFSARAR